MATRPFSCRISTLYHFFEEYKQQRRWEEQANHQTRTMHWTRVLRRSLSEQQSGLERAKECYKKWFYMFFIEVKAEISHSFLRSGFVPLAPVITDTLHAAALHPQEAHTDAKQASTVGRGYSIHRNYRRRQPRRTVPKDPAFYILQFHHCRIK